MFHQFDTDDQAAPAHFPYDGQARGDGAKPFDEQPADAPGVALDVVFQEVREVDEARAMVTGLPPKVEMEFVSRQSRRRHGRRRRRWTCRCRCPCRCPCRRCALSEQQARNRVAHEGASIGAIWSVDRDRILQQTRSLVVTAKTRRLELDPDHVRTSSRPKAAPTTVSPGQCGRSCCTTSRPGTFWWRSLWAALYPSGSPARWMRRAAGPACPTSPSSAAWRVLRRRQSKHGRTHERQAAPEGDRIQCARRQPGQRGEA